MNSTCLAVGISFLLLIFQLNIGYAQADGSGAEILSRSQITALFNDSVKKVFKIGYPIFRVYSYSDRSGQYLCALTESGDSVVKDGEKLDTFNRRIKAIDLKVSNGRLTRVWEMNDYVNEINHGNEEYSIWFWTSYFSFRDYDEDGLVEPMIVYGTWTENGYDDGRVKFIVYYKGKKIAVRHQNSTLDYGRGTETDAAFSSLPKKLRDDVDVKKRLMEKQGKAIF